MHTFPKMLIALGANPGNPMAAIEEAATRWGEESKATKALKAAVSAATTGNWGGPLVSDYGVAIGEFITLVKKSSIVGRLQGLRRIPPRVPYLVQTGGATGSWVAEGKPMPVVSGTFTRKTLDLLKVAALAVMTEELFQSADAEGVVSGDLVKAVVEALDAAFIDPTNAGVAGETPAAVTYGAPTAPLGVIDAQDIGAALADYPGDWANLTFIAHPEFLLNTNAVDFPDLDAKMGGRLRGFPVIASTAVPKDANGGHQLIALDPSSIAYTEEPGATQIKASHQGTIEMNDAPTQDAPTGASQVSLWQNNLVGLAAMLHANWRVERDDSVLILDTVAS